jgi:hypothetical protein
VVPPGKQGTGHAYARGKPKKARPPENSIGAHNNAILPKWVISHTIIGEPAVEMRVSPVSRM